MPSAEWKSKNPDKLRAYRRDWYARNRAASIEKAAVRRKILQGWLKEYKSALSCEKCGERHWACLEFHHRDPSEKDVEIARMAFDKGWGIGRMMAEINKCAVLCANCHRKEHHPLV